MGVRMKVNKAIFIISFMFLMTTCLNGYADLGGTPYERSGYPGEPPPPQKSSLDIYKETIIQQQEQKTRDMQRDIERQHPEYRKLRLEWEDTHGRSPNSNDAEINSAEDQNSQNDSSVQENNSVQDQSDMKGMNNDSGTNFDSGNAGADSSNFDAGSSNSDSGNSSGDSGDSGGSGDDG